MKKTTILLLSLIFSAISLNTMAVESASEALNSRISIELNASIKADSLYAERMITLDIEDELDKSHEIFKIDKQRKGYHLNTKLVGDLNVFSMGLVAGNSAE